MIKTCPWCATAFGDGKPNAVVRRQTYCSQTCSNQANGAKREGPPLIRQCEHCSNDYGHGMRAAEAARHQYCSRACAAGAQIKDDRRGTLRPCPQCGAVFGEGVPGAQIYCSRACVGESQRSPVPTKNCEQCQRPFGDHHAHLARRRFCSHECMRNWRHVNRKPSPYTRWWHRSRASAKARDGFACVSCGKGYERFRLHVHHIDGDERNNELANLVTVCVRCHHAAHRGEIVFMFDDNGIPSAQRLDQETLALDEVGRELAEVAA